jgi:hypothetical protein
MRERKKVTSRLADTYRAGSKKMRGQILNCYIKTTGYNRCYGSYLLRNHGRRIRVNNKLTVIGDVRLKAKRKSKRMYGNDVYLALKKVWYTAGCLCGKRLKPILPELIRKLEKHKELKVNKTIKRNLNKISSATIDRMLKGERRKYTLKGRSLTKPGSLLKHQIPIRTFADWNENKPGFTEIDLVGHECGNASGDFIQTLDMTDIYSGWTETYAVKNKAQVHVFDGFMQIRERLPMPLLGIDSDSGAEFINGHLLRFCRDNKITFTRARPHRKNDNCYVEQKNYSIVRKAVGYFRYDTPKELKLLNELYEYLRLYTNYFQPVMKLHSKTRIGSKVTRRYDTAKTPHTRLLQSPALEQRQKSELINEYNILNPAELKRKITKLQNKLLDIAKMKKKQHRNAEQKRLSTYQQN